MDDLLRPSRACTSTRSDGSIISVPLGSLNWKFLKRSSGVLRVKEE